MKALVADDSTVMRKILINALSQAGITDADQAVDGKEAVAAIMANDYDLVLMDWHMPNMSGIEAVKIIRANGKKMPIIMVSTEAEKSHVIEALKAGVNNFVIKPFKPETIIAKIQQTLGMTSS